MRRQLAKSRMWKILRIYNLISSTNKLHTKKKEKRKEGRKKEGEHEKRLKRHIYQSNAKWRICSDPDSDKCAMKRYFGNYWGKLNMDWVLNNIKEVL